MDNWFRIGPKPRPKTIIDDWRTEHKSHVKKLDFLPSCKICQGIRRCNWDQKAKYEEMKSRDPDVVARLKEMSSTLREETENVELYDKVQLYLEAHKCEAEEGIAPFAECSACKVHGVLQNGLCMVCSGAYPAQCLQMYGDEEVNGLRWFTCDDLWGCPGCIENYVNWGYFPRFNPE